jgi:predicted ATPase
LSWRRGSRGRPFRFLEFSEGQGSAVAGDVPDEQSERQPEALDSADLLAVNTLGQFARHPRVAALRRFITGWYLSYLTADNTRTTPESGPQERLSKTGDNLPNVIQYLAEQHPNRLERVREVLVSRIPRLERVEAEPLADGRLLLRLKDIPFDEPVLAKYASDGTLKMLAYLLVLFDPSPAPLVGIEEPENHLHPRLLPELAEECRSAAARSQLIVTTHSPNFVNAIRPDELWAIDRGPDGYTRARRVSQMQRAIAMHREGANLGDLWLEGYFDLGNPYKQQESLPPPVSEDEGDEE